MKRNIILILITLIAIGMQAQTSCSSCNGMLDKNISVDAGLPPAGFTFSYEWSTGPTTQDIDVTVSGMYFCTVTLSDISLFCADVIQVHSFNVVELPVPVCVIDGPLTICAGDSFQLKETGGASISWAWSSSGTATFDFSSSSMPTVSGAVNGEVITVLITDMNFCQTSCDYIVSTSVCPLLNPTARIAKSEEINYNWNSEDTNLLILVIGILLLILFVWERKK